MQTSLWISDQTIKKPPSTIVEEPDEPPDPLLNLCPTLHFSSPQVHSKPSPCIIPFPSSRTRSSSPAVRAFKKRFYPAVSSREWNDWRWQVRHRIQRVTQLEQMLVLSENERSAMTRSTGSLPLAITPYYMSLLSPDDPQQPLRRSVVPTLEETIRGFGEADDPLGEESQSPVPGLIHRYPDRVLLLLSDFCSTYCRYCTRSRMVGRGGLHPSRSRLESAFDYIRKTPSVRDVLLSGGDPLLVGEERLSWILSQLRRIPHVQIIRIGTKVPAVLPQRITPKLVRMLRQYHPLWMSLHFTHPDECTSEAYRACAMLADAGIPLGSQTVLLKGINDNVETMRTLMHQLMQMRVKPYYLYQCDPITGSAHFRTPVDKGLEIIRDLRGFTSGYAVPTYVIDAPGGGGKIPLMPEYIVGREDGVLLLRNYEKNLYRYPDGPNPGNAADRFTELSGIATQTECIPVDFSSDQVVHCDTGPGTLVNGPRREEQWNLSGEQSPMKMKIGLTYDLRSEYLAQGYSQLETAEFDREDTVEAIENALHSLGHATERIGNAKQLAAALGAGKRWDLVFNIAEGLHGIGREAQVPSLLDLYGIPYTFSDPLIMSLTLHKGMAKRIIRDAGIPTTDFVVAENEDDVAMVAFPPPFFVKPVAEGTGKGITPASIIWDRQSLPSACRQLMKAFRQPVLIEPYLPGREFTVGLVGTGSVAMALGTIEVHLGESAEAGVYSYDNKANYVGRVSYELIRSEDDPAVAAAERIALAAWRVLGCRDAGRIDLRCDSAGRPLFMEVNPLAGIHPVISDLPIICNHLGVPYVDLIERIVASASLRIGEAL